MVTDDVNTYKPAVERLGVQRQICATHVKKRVWNRLDRYRSAGLDQGEDMGRR